MRTRDNRNALGPDDAALALLAFHDDHTPPELRREGHRKGLSRRPDESRVVVDAHGNRLGFARFFLGGSTGNDAGPFSLRIRADPNHGDLPPMFEQRVDLFSVLVRCLPGSPPAST